MNIASSIINTKIVDSSYDDFWNDVPVVLSNIQPTKVLVLINGYTAGSNEEILLTKMLEACKLQTTQYKIATLDTNVAWHKLKEIVQPKVVFLFGIHPQQLGISALFILNEPNRFHDCIWLPVPPLNVVESNKDVKKQLWENGMKPIFIENKFGKI